jgi:hypothetical protein
MSNAVRRIVRYRNRKLYEPVERRFVTLDDIARSVASGVRIEVRAADTGEDITARVLSRALASERTSSPPSADAISILLRAGSDAAETVAEVAERVGAARMAASVRRVSSPERIAETFAPVARRLETARQDVERIVGGLVGRGRLTWEEGTRLKEDVGTVFREGVADVLGRVRDLLHRLSPSATPEVRLEIEDLSRRIDQLEEMASTSFPKSQRTTRGFTKEEGVRAAPSRKKESHPS